MQVNSEIDNLRKVVVHAPDSGLERITPSKALEFLYDDIVFLPQMQREHALFRDVLSIFLGEDHVYDTYALLRDISDDPKVRELLIDAVIELEEIDESYKAKLLDVDVDGFVFTMFTGTLRKGVEHLFPPLPNYVFTRDIGVAINDHLLICHAAKKPRSRENLISRAIFRFHPLFSTYAEGEKFIDMTDEDEDVTIEGGDVMILSKDYLMVGCSERTSLKGVEMLVERLFERKVIKHVLRVDIPKYRSFMHIDTLFTQISKNDVVIYEPLLHDLKLASVTHYQAGKGVVEYKITLRDAFVKVNSKYRFIPCGNGEFPHDEREQWTDGCNLVAVRDGVAIAYRRNHRTAFALEHAGYDIRKAENVLKEWKAGILNPKKLVKTIITIPSAELSRARGGPHCMTFPIERKM